MPITAPTRSTNLGKELLPEPLINICSHQTEKSTKQKSLGHWPLAGNWATICKFSPLWSCLVYRKIDRNYCWTVWARLTLLPCPFQSRGSPCLYQQTKRASAIGLLLAGWGSTLNTYTETSPRLSLSRSTSGRASCFGRTVYTKLFIAPITRWPKERRR